MTIKRSPADFIVEEVLSPVYAVTGRPGAFAVYLLEKEGLTTPDAVSAFAAALGVDVKDVEYAGLKDRHARTEQHVSVRTEVRSQRSEVRGRKSEVGGQRSEVGREGVPPEIVEGRGWSAQRIGWAREAISAAAIACNRFSITVRGLSSKAAAQMDEAADLLGTDGGLAVVNYYGDQRFGSARHGRGFPARHLVRGEFEAALRLCIATPARKDSRRDKEFFRAVDGGWGRWEKLDSSLPPHPLKGAVGHLAAHPGDFRGAFLALPYFLQKTAVEAYQSWLWNAVARGLVERTCTAPGILIRAEDPFGELIFPPVKDIPGQLLKLNLPHASPDTVPAKPWGDIMEEVLAAGGVALSDMQIAGARRPRFGVAPRPLFATAGSFTMSAPAPEKTAPGKYSRALSFTLPRGAYATVVLRALGQ